VRELLVVAGVLELWVRDQVLVARRQMWWVQV
jgi:hypothetical protein